MPVTALLDFTEVDPVGNKFGFGALVAAVDVWVSTFGVTMDDFWGTTVAFGTPNTGRDVVSALLRASSGRCLLTGLGFEVLAPAVDPLGYSSGQAFKENR